MCIMTMFLIGVRSSLTPAQGNEFSNATLKGISAISVLVEDLPDGAKVLGLTKESIQTDVELKLRLAGMTVVTLEESNSLPGRPYLYVFVNVTARPGAARIDVSLHQDARLERDGQRVTLVQIRVSICDRKKAEHLVA